MWQFLLALVFGSTFQITPAPVVITGSWREVPLDRQFKALNSGAVLQIDVTSIISPTDSAGHDALDRLESAEKHFPHGCVAARLVSKGRGAIFISNVSEAASATQTFVELSGKNGMLAPFRFDKLYLRASCSMSGVKVYWRNYGM